MGPFIGELVLSRLGYDAAWLTAAGIAVLATVLTLLVPETAPGSLAGGRRSRTRVRLIHPAGHRCRGC